MSTQAFRAGLSYSILLASVICLPSFAEGQDTYRNLAGTVMDRQHEPLKGAVVQVHDPNEHTVVSYITDRTGHYSFKRLSGEVDYEIWATYRDHRSSKKTWSHFDVKPEKFMLLTIKLD